MNTRSHVPLPSANPSTGPPGTSQKKFKSPFSSNRMNKTFFSQHRVKTSANSHQRVKSAGNNSSTLSSNLAYFPNQQELEALQYSSKIFLPSSLQSQVPIGSIVEIRSVRQLMTVKQQSRFTTQNSRDQKINDDQLSQSDDNNAMFTNTFQSTQLAPTPLSYSMVIRPEQINLSEHGKNRTKFSNRLHSVRPSGIQTPMYHYNKNAGRLQHDIDAFQQQKRLFMTVEGFFSSQQTVQMPRWALNVLKVEQGQPIFVRLSQTRVKDCVVPSNLMYWSVRFIDDNGDKSAMIGRDGERKMVNAIKSGYSVLTNGQIIKIQLNQRDVLLRLKLLKYKPKQQYLPTLLVGSGQNANVSSERKMLKTNNFIMERGIKHQEINDNIDYSLNRRNTLLNPSQPRISSSSASRPSQSEIQLFYYNDPQQHVHYRVEYARPGSSSPQEIQNLKFIQKLMGVQVGTIKKGEMQYSDINALIREKGMDFDLMEKFFKAKQGLKAEQQKQERAKKVAKVKKIKPTDIEQEDDEMFARSGGDEMMKQVNLEGRESPLLVESKDIKSTVTFQGQNSANLSPLHLQSHAQANLKALMSSPPISSSPSSSRRKNSPQQQNTTQAIIYNSVLAPNKGNSPPLSPENNRQKDVAIAVSPPNSPKTHNLSHIEDANGVYYDVRALLKQREKQNKQNQDTIAKERKNISPSQAANLIVRGVRSPKYFHRQQDHHSKEKGYQGQTHHNIDLAEYLKMKESSHHKQQIENMFKIDSNSQLRPIHTSDFKYRKEMMEQSTRPVADAAINSPTVVEQDQPKKQLAKQLGEQKVRSPSKRSELIRLSKGQKIIVNKSMEKSSDQASSKHLKGGGGSIAISCPTPQIKNIDTNQTERGQSPIPHSLQGIDGGLSSAMDSGSEEQNTFTGNRQLPNRFNQTSNVEVKRKKNSNKNHSHFQSKKKKRNQQEDEDDDRKLRNTRLSASKKQQQQDLNTINTIDNQNSISSITPNIQHPIPGQTISSSSNKFQTKTQQQYSDSNPAGGQYTQSHLSVTPIHLHPIDSDAKTKILYSQLKQSPRSNHQLNNNNNNSFYNQNENTSMYQTNMDMNIYQPLSTQHNNEDIYSNPVLSPKQQRGNLSPQKRVVLKMGEPPVFGPGAEKQLMENRERLQIMVEKQRRYSVLKKRKLGQQRNQSMNAAASQFTSNGQQYSDLNKLLKSIEFHSPHATRTQSISQPNSQTLIVSDTTTAAAAGGGGVGVGYNLNFPPRPKQKLPPVNTVTDDTIILQDIVEQNMGNFSFQGRISDRGTPIPPNITQNYTDQDAPPKILYERYIDLEIGRNQEQQDEYPIYQKQRNNNSAVVFSRNKNEQIKRLSQPNQNNSLEYFNNANIQQAPDRVVPSRQTLSRTPNSAIIRYLPGGRAGAPPNFMHHRKISQIAGDDRSSVRSYSNHRGGTRIVTQSDLLSGIPRQRTMVSIFQQQNQQQSQLQHNEQYYLQENKILESRFSIDHPQHKGFRMQKAKKFVSNQFIQGSVANSKLGNNFTERLKRMHMRSRDAKEAVLKMVSGGKFIAPTIPASMAGNLLHREEKKGRKDRNNFSFS